MDMSRITVTIDRLRLRGFEPGEDAAVADGLKTELARLLSDPTTRAEIVRSRRIPVLRLNGMGLETGTVGRRKFVTGMAHQVGKALKW